MHFNTNRLSTALLILTLALGIAACSRGSTELAEDTAGGEDSGDANASRNVTLRADGAGGRACSLEQVYFGFDSDELDDASRSAIQRAVSCYRNEGLPARMHLTGATDPRGTEEYNIALGDRRAQSVRTYLVALGIDAGGISVSSVGEEMAEGSDESGWARDRHVATAE